MSLKEVLEETRKQLAEAQAAEEETVIDEPTVTESEENETQSAEENNGADNADAGSTPEGEDTGKDKTAAVAKTEPEPPHDATYYAKQRREERARRDAELAELRKQVDDLKAAKTEPTEPNKEENYEKWLEWKIEQQESQLRGVNDRLAKEEERRQYEENIRGAMGEIGKYRDEFVTRSKAADFDDVAGHYEAVIKASVLTLQPYLTPEQVAHQVQTQIITRAAHYENMGYNPVEAMYNEAKNRLGYKAKEVVVEKPTKEEKKPTPDMAKVAKNRERSSGFAAGGGSGEGGVLTPNAAAELTNAEWAKLSKEEKKRLLSGM